MKKIFKLLLSMLAIFSAACSPDTGDETENTEGGFENQTFTISVLNITSDEATVSVTPSIQGTYYFDLIKKEELEKFEFFGNFANAVAAKIKELCEAENISISNFLSSGADSYQYSLEPDTEYYAYAFEMSIDGEVLEGNMQQPFKTLLVGPSVEVLEVSKDISEPNTALAKVKITPSNDEDTYFCSVVKKSEINSLGNRLEAAQSLLEAEKNNLEAEGESLSEALLTGNQLITINKLELATEYCVLAYGAAVKVEYDEKNKKEKEVCVVTTDATVVEFTTPAPKEETETPEPEPQQLATKSAVKLKYSQMRGDFTL